MGTPDYIIGITKQIRKTKIASKKRKKAEEAGEHRPPFLIASITAAFRLAKKMVQIY